MRCNRVHCHQEEAEAEAQSHNLELINSVSKLRIAGAEAFAAQWWAERYQQVVKLENSLDIKEATAALLQNIMPNLGTLMIYIMITRLLAEARIHHGECTNIGQQLGFFTAFNFIYRRHRQLAGLFAGAFDLPVIYERVRPLLDTAPESRDNNEEIGTLEGNLQLDRVSYRYDDDQPLVLDNVISRQKQVSTLRLSGHRGPANQPRPSSAGLCSPEDGNTSTTDDHCLAWSSTVFGAKLHGPAEQLSIQRTMMEAIAGGAVIQEDQAWHAAELAGLADDIRAMPMGMQTIF